MDTEQVIFASSKCLDHKQKNFDVIFKVQSDLCRIWSICFGGVLFSAEVRIFFLYSLRF